MTNKELSAMVDHTLLKQTTTWEEIKKLCDEAVEFETASVCIPPCYVKQAVSYLEGRIPVCTVIGFPNGNTTTASKVFEASEAVENGASEIDMVINIGFLRAGDEDYVREEIRQVKKAVGAHILKVIIEACLLSDAEKVKMCRIVGEAGADYIKSSTGFSQGGATVEDVALFAAHVGNDVKIKAAGGIQTLEDAKRFVALGARRLGTSRVVKLLKDEKPENLY